MVDRSGFYINGDKICRVDVKIDWNLGFDKLAKEAYVAHSHVISNLHRVPRWHVNGGLHGSAFGD